VVFEDRVKVSFYEIPELALSIQNHQGLCEPTKWLPENNPRRTYFEFYIVLEAPLNLTQLLSFSSLKKFCKIQP